MAKQIEITDETAAIVTALAQSLGCTEADIVADAVSRAAAINRRLDDRLDSNASANSDIAMFAALRTEIDQRIATNQRLPADEVFGRLHARHQQRLTQG